MLFTPVTVKTQKPFAVLIKTPKPGAVASKALTNMKYDDYYDKDCDTDTKAKYHCIFCSIIFANMSLEKWG